MEVQEVICKFAEDFMLCDNAILMQFKDLSSLLNKFHTHSIFSQEKVLKSFAFTRILEQVLENKSKEELYSLVLNNLSQTEWMQSKKDSYRSPILTVADVEGFSKLSAQLIKNPSDFESEKNNCLDLDAKNEFEKHQDMLKEWIN